MFFILYGIQFDNQNQKVEQFPSACTFMVPPADFDEVAELSAECDEPVPYPGISFH